MSHSLRFLTLAAFAAATMAAGPSPAAPSNELTPTHASLSFGTTVATPKPRQIEVPPSADFTTAPVPNTDANIPFVKNPRASQAQLGPGLFAPPSTGYRGEGYVPGSTAEGEQQRKLKPAPGINLTVPLN
jgi:hypothetical protein